MINDTFAQNDGEEEPTENVTHDDSDDEPNVHSHNDEHGDIVEKNTESEQDGSEKRLQDIRRGESLDFLIADKLSQKCGKRRKYERKNNGSCKSAISVNERFLKQNIKVRLVCKKVGRHAVHVGHVMHSSIFHVAVAGVARVVGVGAGRIGVGMVVAGVMLAQGGGRTWVHAHIYCDGSG